MNARILQYYEDEEQARLKILRLSGKQLKMENCYINLSVIESSSDRRVNREVLDLSLRKRLQIEAPSEGKDIQLKDLYRERELRGGKTGIPKRILIRGRPGVGKTTLCKKIVHDIIHDNLPSWGFERVLWIPLRKLEGNVNPEESLCNDFCPRNEDGGSLHKSLLNIIADKHQDMRTLFILDGLDEIANQMRDNDKLTALLNRDNVIITSRPYAIDPYILKAFDLELETVGFRPDQVQEYIRRVYAENTELASEIQKFVLSNWLIEGLLQIPIQLDALCYTWEERPLGGDVTTMTSLYQAMEVKIWRKDMVNLGKSPENESKNYWNRESIQVSMQHEIDLLEKFAFNGLLNDLVEFLPGHRETLYKKLPGKIAETDNTFNGLSFLRTSSEGDHGKTYQFIHLTFQELFAANYFVQCWISKESLVLAPVEPVDKADCKHIRPEEFLQQERYNGHYDIMWRFAAGLLSIKNKDALVLFMQAVDSDPKDLLGSAHPRILMHCFNEIPKSEINGTLENLKQKLDERLSRLLSITHEDSDSFRWSLPLAHGMEFSEELYNPILAQGTITQKETALHALSERAQVLPNLLKQVAAPDVSVSSKLKKNTCRVLARNYSASPELVMKNLNPRTAPDHEVRDYTRYYLPTGPKLPDNILRSLIDGFDDCSDSSPELAADTVREQPSLGEDISARMISLLKSENFSVREHAVHGLSKHLAVNEIILPEILNLQHDEHQKVRVQVATPLGNAPDRPGVLETLSCLLKDRAGSVREHAARSLGKQRTLLQGLLSDLFDAIEDDDYFLRSAALSAWSKHCTSSDEEVALKLCSKLHDPKRQVRKTARDCLEERSMFPDDQSLLEDLQKGTMLEKEAAVACLEKRSDLNDEIPKALQRLLSDTESYLVQSLVIEIIKHQTEFPDVALKPLRSLLGDGHEATKINAIDALRRHQKLPEEILESLAQLLNEDSLARYSLEALRNQQNLPLVIIGQVIPLLSSESREMRYAAESVFRDHADLSAVLPNLNRETLAALLRLWFDKSLDENLTCCCLSDRLVLGTPLRTYEIKITSPSQQADLEYALKTVEEMIPNLPTLDQKSEALDSQAKIDVIESSGVEWVHCFLFVYLFGFSVFIAFLAM